MFEGRQQIEEKGGGHNHALYKYENQANLY